MRAVSPSPSPARLVVFGDWRRFATHRTRRAGPRRAASGSAGGPSSRTRAADQRRRPRLHRSGDLELSARPVFPLQHLPGRRVQHRHRPEGGAPPGLAAGVPRRADPDGAGPALCAVPDVRATLWLQGLALALGAIPAYRLAQRRLGSPPAGLAFAMVYLLAPLGQWAAAADFHSVALAAPLLMLAIDALDAGEPRLFLVAGLLAASTKEEIGLLVAARGAGATALCVAGALPLSRLRGWGVGAGGDGGGCDSLESPPSCSGPGGRRCAWG